MNTRDLDRHITGNYGEDQLLTICPDCGSANTQEAEDGLYDCLACGVWFDPAHPLVQQDQARFVAQVFDGPRLVACGAVQAETWQEARKSVQSKFQNLVVSVHAMETYLLSGKSRQVERGE